MIIFAFPLVEFTGGELSNIVRRDRHALSVNQKPIQVISMLIKSRVDRNRVTRAETRVQGENGKDSGYRYVCGRS